MPEAAHRLGLRYLITIGDMNSRHSSVWNAGSSAGLREAEPVAGQHLDEDWQAVAHGRSQSAWPSINTARYPSQLSPYSVDLSTSILKLVEVTQSFDLFPF